MQETPGVATPSATSREEWDEIARRLREPFDPNDVDFRVQGKASEQTGKAQVVAYVDARVVQDRLDAVLGIGNWSFDWQALIIDKGEVMVAKGTVTILGVAKSDAGSASNFEQSLGAVSHCFKRAAVHWGVGRYLYNLPMAWVQVERGRIPAQVLRDLRAQLPRPGQQGQAARQGDQGEHQGAEGEREGRGAARAARATPAPAQPRAPQADQARQADQGAPMATEKQLASIGKLCEALGKPRPQGDLSYAEARDWLSRLSGEFQRARRAS